MKGNDKKKWLYWLPPKGSAYYFNPASDDEYKYKHPIGYVLLVIAVIIMMVAPLALYALYVFSVYGDGGNRLFMLGFVGCFVVAIGFCNFLSIIIGQYLGHLVTILSFVVGGAMIALSLLIP